MYIQVEIFHNYSTCPDRVNENSKNLDNLYIQVNIFLSGAVNALLLLPVARPAVHFSCNTCQTGNIEIAAYRHIDKNGPTGYPVEPFAGYFNALRR